MTIDIEIRYYTRHRMLWNSISSALNLENIDIEEHSISIQYDTEEYSISKHKRSTSTYHNIEETSISKLKTSITLYTDIEDFSHTDIEDFLVIDKCPFDISIRYRRFFCFDIEFRAFRYRCFFVGSSGGDSSLGCLLGTGHRLRCAHCIANQSLPVAHVPSGPPSAAAAEAALSGAAAPAAPGAAPAAAAGAGLGRRSGCRSRRRGHQRNAGARDSWRQELTGVKFGMIIWTRLGGSCLGLLQTKTMSKFSRTLTK
jgi:hypothetical protein